MKERVDDRLNTLYEALQLENAQLKIELGERTTINSIIQNTLRTTSENYEGMINSLKLQFAMKAEKQPKKDEENKENVDMKESYVEPQNEDKLNGLKKVIVDQQGLLEEHEENWESIYFDLISCVQLLQDLEKQEDEKAKAKAM